MDKKKLEKICQLIRYDILTSTTAAGSGHPTSSLSAVELMVMLFFNGYFRQDFKDPENIANDRFILSKGHASPLLYSLYHAAGVISYEELMTLRKFGSRLEGHPTPRFPYADITTGSLGQGLSAGVGMALGIKLNVGKDSRVVPKVFVLLGDSEIAEGQVWEAIQLASFYKLNNIIGILDINRLGQRGETMLGWNIEAYEKRIASFGWNTIVIDDGNDLTKVYKAFEKASRFLTSISRSPTMILAKTIKGKGISFLENKNGWHGKPVPKDMLESALKELGKVDLKVRGKIIKPNVKLQMTNDPPKARLAKGGKSISNYKLGDQVATRMAYGDALLGLGDANEKIVVLDAEMSNSTYSEKFAKKFPERYFEMFIAEQNMITAALGISKMGFIPFASTFSAFLTRGFDQLRMAQYSTPNLKIVGSHCGVSIGPDGSSQMGLEDISMFRSILNSTIFYPADAISTFKLTKIMAENDGFFYLRTNRKETPVIYGKEEKFKIGGSKIHKVKNPHFAKASRGKQKSKVLIIAAGITLHKALEAQKKLAEQGIETVVLDCYSVKPLDVQSINQLVKEAKNVVVVEDHYPAGGIGEAVMQVLLANFKFQISNFKFIHLCVRKIPMSGTPEELLKYEEIDAEAIIKAVKKITNKK